MTRTYNALGTDYEDAYDYEDYIVIYRISDGSYIGAVRVDPVAGEDEYELENICLIGNRIWFGFHDGAAGYHIHTAVVG